MKYKIKGVDPKKATVLGKPYMITVKYRDAGNVVYKNNIPNSNFEKISESQFNHLVKTGYLIKI